jgi:hypothetical protein
MSGTSATLDTLASPALRRRSLVARTIAVTALDASTRDAAFALFRATYDGTSRERFEHDLAEKQHVILLHDRETGALKGFSTVLVRALDSPRGAATVVFSGDTVIDREYWGQKQLQLAFARLLATLKLRSPARPLYWFLISKGYKTYRFLPIFFHTFHPHPARPMPDGIRMALDGLACAKYPHLYDAERGVIRAGAGHDRLRAGVAEITPQRLRDPFVRFFLERNPGHILGEELCCLAPLTRENFTPAAYRVIDAEPAVVEASA